MILSCWRKHAIYTVTFVLMCVSVMVFAGCGATGSRPTNTRGHAQSHPTPQPTATPTTATITSDNGQGQKLLDDMAHQLNTASSLHGLFNLGISGLVINGTMNSEIWNVAPDKSRVEVKQSTLSQEPAGAITVTDGTTLWQYDPTQNVVYTGPVSAEGGDTTDNSFANNGSGQSRFLLGIIETIFNQSAGTLQSSGTSVDGHSVDDVHIVPASPSGATTGSLPGSFTYTGEVYIDQSSHLPVRVTLHVQDIGEITLDLPELDLNQPIPDNTFTFVPPAGAQVLPLQQATQTPDDGSTTFVQAQRQAGFHLLSISSNQPDYVLQSVTTQGLPSAPIFVLNYMKGNQSFSVAQGKALADLPVEASQSIQIRHVHASFSTNGAITTLSWTEHGVGIRIFGSLSHDQLLDIADILS